MRDQIEAALRGHDAEYIEIRIEEAEASHLAYRGRELEDVGRSTSLGGCVRALVKGGWSFATFNEVDHLREKVVLAVAQARLVAGEVKLASVAPMVAVVPAEIKKDPISIPLAEKKRLLEEYNAILWSLPQIQTTSLGYGDSRRRVVFASSEGSYIEQEFVDATARINATARDGSAIQQAGISIGARGDYSFVEGLHAQVEAVGRRAVRLLSAPQPKGGEYTVVLDPVLAGVFIHEAFGHLSEADFVHENPRMKEIMVLGRRFGEDFLNVVDGAAALTEKGGLRGSYAYDDEGVPAQKTYLIREGVLVGRLHSRETAAAMGEAPTGNARAISYRHRPIVRMTNTYIEPQSTSFDDIIADIDEGIYAKEWYGGTSSMEMFTFSAGEAYMIRHGKIAEPLRGVVLSGNVFTTLANIDAIGDDLEMNQGGGCGKGGQFPLPVSNGSPHIRIRRCLVGGR